MTSVCCGHLHWAAWHGINCQKYEARCRVRCSDAVLTQDKMQCVLHLPLSIMPRVTLSPTLNLNALQTLLTRDPCYHLISGDSHCYWLLGAVHKWHFLGSLAPLGGYVSLLSSFGLPLGASNWWHHLPQKWPSSFVICERPHTVLTLCRVVRSMAAGSIEELYTLLLLAATCTQHTCTLLPQPEVLSLAWTLLTVSWSKR